MDCCFVSGLPFVLYMDCHLVCIWIAICYPETKQMAIHIQSKWQSRYKTNGNPGVAVCFVIGLPFVLHMDCHLLCIWIAICFVHELPFVLYLDCHLFYIWRQSIYKEIAIQLQNKWQSRYKTNGNPDTKQTAIHIQRNSIPVTKQMAIQI
jgi:hypothetical protein